MNSSALPLHLLVELQSSNPIHFFRLKRKVTAGKDRAQELRKRNAMGSGVRHVARLFLLFRFFTLSITLLVTSAAAQGEEKWACGHIRGGVKKVVDELEDHEKMYAWLARARTKGILFWGLIRLISSPAATPAIFAGTLLGYVTYDCTHYYLHHGSPSNQPARHLKRYHLNHHFRVQTKGFGITSSLWDFVFGTSPPALKIQKRS